MSDGVATRRFPDPLPAVLGIASAILAAIAGKLFTQARARHAKATTLHSEQEAEAWLALAEAILGGALHRIQRTH